MNLKDLTKEEQLKDSFVDNAGWRVLWGAGVHLISLVIDLQFQIGEAQS